MQKSQMREQACKIVATSSLYLQRYGSTASDNFKLKFIHLCLIYHSAIPNFFLCMKFRLARFTDYPAVMREY